MHPLLRKASQAKCPQRRAEYKEAYKTWKARQNDLREAHHSLLSYWEAVSHFSRLFPGSTIHLSPQIADYIHSLVFRLPLQDRQSAELQFLSRIIMTAEGEAQVSAQKCFEITNLLLDYEQPRQEEREQILLLEKEGQNDSTNTE